MIRQDQAANYPDNMGSYMTDYTAEISRTTFLVTGSAGFIGFHVARALLDHGARVVGLDNFNDYYSPALKHDRDRELRRHPNFVSVAAGLTDLPALEALFEAHRPGKICHLAAQAGVRYSLVNPFAYQKSNLEGFLNLLELAKRFPPERLVYASSSSVYAGLTAMPFTETQRVDTPINLYAATKKANELMAHAYSHLFGLPTVGLRFFTVYGPWGRPDMAMWLFTEAMLKGQPIKVFNYGQMQRDFTYIDDIVQGVVAALMAPGLDRYEIINLGNHRAEDLQRVIGILERELKLTAEQNLLPIQPGDVPATFADIGRARTKLGFEPLTPIEVGIPRFVQWYFDYHGLPRR
jgi:UDP-glucuronate 4-epimerase